MLEFSCSLYANLFTDKRKIFTWLMHQREVYIAFTFLVFFAWTDNFMVYGI